MIRRQGQWTWRTGGLRARSGEAVILGTLMIAFLAGIPAFGGSPLSPSLAQAAPTAKANTITPITLWHAHRDTEEEVLKAVVRDFNTKHPTTPLELLAVPFDQFANKLMAAIPHGAGPDLFIGPHDRLADFADRDLITPMEPATVRSAEDDFDTFALAPLKRDDGQTYALPYALKCVALFHNRALAPTAPANTEAWLAQAAALTGGGRFGVAYEVGSPYFHAAWVHGFGGHIFPDPEGAARLDTPAQIAALDEVARWALRARVLPEEPSGALVTRLFNEGKAAFIIAGPWALGDIDKTIDYGVAPLPTLSATGLPLRPYLTVEGVFVVRHPEGTPGRSGSAGLRRIEAVRDALAWLVDDDSARHRLNTARQIVPNRRVYGEQVLFRGGVDPIVGAFRAQAAQAVPMPTRPEMAALWEPWAQALRRTLRGSDDPRTALVKAQQRLATITRESPPDADPEPYQATLAVSGFLAFGGMLLAFARRERRQRLWRTLWAYGYVLPAAAGITLTVVAPFLVGAAVSLFAHERGEWRFVGLANFQSIVSTLGSTGDAPSFLFTLAVTVAWTAVNVGLHVILGVGLALLLHRHDVRLSWLFRVLLIVPWAVPNYITALVWKSMFHKQFGAVNALLVALGLEPISWFSHFSTAFAANVATNVWLGFPFMMVVALGALQSIPKDLYEAAAVDGAGPWRCFRDITAPLLVPAMLPAILLGAVWTFNMFNVIYLVSGGEPDGTTDILVSEAYKWAFERQHQYGYAAAYAVLIFGVLLCWHLVATRLTRRPSA